MPVRPMEARMARLEGAYEQVSLRLMNIDPRFDGVDRRFDALDRKIDLLRDALDAKTEQRFNALDAKIDQRFMWTVGIVLTSWVTTIAAIYLHH